MRGGEEGMQGMQGMEGDQLGGRTSLRCVCVC